LPIFIYPRFNMSPVSFPCPSCGGPVEPLSGKIRLACPYCGSSVNIPENLQIKEKPAEVPEKSTTPYFMPPPPREGDDITDVLNQVKPLAAGAMKAYGIWAMLRMLWRRVVPACAVILMILCLLVCGASVLLIFLSQRGA
jgi:DNA-directed RNA polymerase subunit RPC12/RpoP